MKKFNVAGICGILVMFGVVPSAWAMPQFKSAFEKRYVNDSNDEAFKATAKKESCNACHVKGENKKVRNAYGEALAKLIEGDAQQRMKDAGTDAAKTKAVLDALLGELEKAFDETEAMHIDEKDESSPTYGELLKSGKLPASEPAKDQAGP